MGLGKFEAMYSELFAEVIDDGVITAEERAQLERTATALGLDRERLRALEGALQSVYELRHRVKIVEVDDAGAPSQRGSLVPIEPATDARTQALERRVADAPGSAWRSSRRSSRRRGRTFPSRWTSLAWRRARDGCFGGSRNAAAKASHDARDVETLRALYRA